MRAPWSRWFRKRKPVAIADARRGEAWISGAVTLEGEAYVVCPLTGAECAVVYYHAQVPGALNELYAIAGVSGRREVANSVQGVDFVVEDESGRARVLMGGGADLLELHARLSQAHGLSLEATTLRIVRGDRVRVRGRVVEERDASPMRGEGIRCTIRAADVELLDG